MRATSKSEKIRASLKHPVIDGDGHVIEYRPLFEDYLLEVAGRDLTDRWRRQNLDARSADNKGAKAGGWYSQSQEDRIDRRTTRPPFWAMPTRNTRDLATAMMPKLLAARMDEIGIDYSIIYPTMGLFMPRDPNSELRRATCRALNRMLADLFRPHAGRMTPAAAIPMHTPAEAVEELEYCVTELGYKVAMIAGHVRRPIPIIAREAPGLAGFAQWVDNLALDSLHDYDPFWKRCVDLRIAPTIHTGSMGWGSRTSISNYNFNHIGHFAAANEVSAKALFFGGVTRRFPMLKFGLLEGGVGWATSLYADLVGHWEKRNRKALERLDPANVNQQLFLELAEEYGDDRFLSKVRANGDDQAWIERSAEDRANIDEWSRSQITRKEDIRTLFAEPFYFGCEADDASVPGAFNHRLNPMGSKLKAIFSSDIGHWDVEDISEVLEEAYELVEHAHIDEGDFRAFTFSNIADLHSSLNRDFFKGTAVEDSVAALQRNASISKAQAAE